MKIYKYLLLSFIFILSCNHSKKNSLSVNIYENEKINQDSIKIDSLSIMNYSAEEIIKKYKSPDLDIQYPLCKIDRPRWILKKYFSEDSSVIIRELNWKTNSDMILSVWYVLNDSLWQPFYFDYIDIKAEY